MSDNLQSGLLEQYRAVVAITETIVSYRGLPELFRDLAGQLHQVVKFDALFLLRYDESANTISLHILETFVALNQGRPGPMDADPDTDPAGWVIHEQKPIVITNHADAARWPLFLELVQKVGVHSLCILPLTSARRRLGVVGFARVQPDAFHEGDVDFLTLVVKQVAVAVENALAFEEIKALKEQLEKEKVYLEEEIRTDNNFEEIVGESTALRRVLQEVETVAPTRSTVLIRGETGTGKELIARALHDLSPRRERTFVKLNCAAIPTGLLESELFGHEKGAFTGAISQKVGRFELASKGTLFLDEVGDIPPELQPKLLRVLQEQEFERLGSNKTVRVDVRLVAATNRDLAQMVAAGLFRADLYYRLNVFPLLLPSLRERRDDIPRLVRHFTQKFAKRMGKTIETIPSETLKSLVDYSWPGNIRELENIMERAVILSPGLTLQVDIGNLEAKQAGSVEIMLEERSENEEDSKTGGRPFASLHLVDAEREHILRVLHDSGWVLGGPNGAAARLGMKRTTLQSKMKKLGLKRSR